MRTVGLDIGTWTAALGRVTPRPTSVRWARALVSALAAKSAGLTPIGRAYAEAASDERPIEFSTRALEALQVRGRIVSGTAAHVPVDGPLLVVANHPYGAIDALLLLDLLTSRRRDVKLLANRMLGALPPLRDRLVLVEVFGGRAATRRNAIGLRQAIAWLRSRGCLAVFPAGEVAHRMVEGRVVDSEWHRGVAEMAVRTQATIVPVFFEGHNSRLFRHAGVIHPLLRTALLPRELSSKRGTLVRMHVGAPIPFETVACLRDANASTAFLRAQVEALAVLPSPTPVPSSPSFPSTAGRASTLAARSHPTEVRTQEAAAQEAVARRGSLDAILSDIEGLGPSALLLESGAYQVFCARALELPNVLPELGRLREDTFRLAGEGTGRSRDLDGFDDTYQHLFVWDRMAREIAGAYRVGATDEVGATGVNGLYTRTLFEYGDALLHQIGPALELGRSFVQPAYQRDYSPLMLLWKGISRVVTRAPRYRRLFGVVSISDRYDSTSRQLLVRFLQTTRFDADLGRLVRAKNPPPPPREPCDLGGRIDRLEDVSSRVRELEPDGKDIPVLLRQYLKLNAKLLGFTIDPAFGNALDGLVVVDLADVEPAILARYMGRAEAEAFRRASTLDT